MGHKVNLKKIAQKLINFGGEYPQNEMRGMNNEYPKNWMKRQIYVSGLNIN
jgi:hypothetical protein